MSAGGRVGLVCLAVVIFLGGALFRGTQVEGQSIRSAAGTAGAVLALFALVVAVGSAVMWMQERGKQASDPADDASGTEVGP